MAYITVVMIYFIAVCRAMLGGISSPSTSDLLNIINKMNQSLNLLSQENMELRNNMTKLQNRLHQTMIAFTASLSHEIKSVGDKQTIEFDNVLTNLGNAYDPRHGHFTAPIRGLYQVSSTMIGTSHQDNSFEMVKNGAVICRPYSAVGNTSPTGSCVVNLVLEVNDMVWIRWNYGGRDLYGQDYSSFSGFLINTM